jgi:hypothetical protein
MQYLASLPALFVCITPLRNLVFIPGFFLWNLRIPAAIIGWGCHPLFESPWLMEERNRQKNLKKIMVYFFDL